MYTLVAIKYAMEVTMLQRIGISINHEELKQASALQRRFGLRSRSELFRELLKRYETLERQWNALNQCLHGYIEHPESGEETKAILKTTLKAIPPEDWA